MCLRVSYCHSYILELGGFMFKKCLLVLVLLAGCRGHQGEKGDLGNTGLPGTGVATYSGAITSDLFYVTIPVNPNRTAQVTVYVSDGILTAELPYYLVALGVNAFNTYEVSGNHGVVTFYNCKLAQAVTWKVVVILN